jgi:hypothetical protein
MQEVYIEIGHDLFLSSFSHYHYIVFGLYQAAPNILHISRFKNRPSFYLPQRLSWRKGRLDRNLPLIG